MKIHLKRPQPAFPMLLGHRLLNDLSVHVSPQTMRTHPIGTGPFKFVEFKPNEVIRVARNPDYWKPERSISMAWSTRSCGWPLFPGSST